MNRPLIVTMFGAATVVAAIGLNYYYAAEDEAGAQAVAERPAPEQDAGGSPASPSAPESAAREPAPETPPPVEKPEAAADTPAPVAPTFDVVRINPEGDAVIAGRAMPNSKVVIRDGERTIGEAAADSRGEWVFVPDQPLPAGNREIGIEATDEDGTTVESESVVVLAVPERGEDIAGNPSTAPVKPLAVQVPRDGHGPSRVLQKPAAPSAPAQQQQGNPGKRAESPAEAAPMQGSQEDSPVVVRLLPSRDGQTTSEAAAPRNDEKVGGRAVLVRPDAPSSAPQAEPTRPPAASPPRQHSKLTIETVDYDDLGNLSLSGNVDQGGIVQTYLDNQFLGRTRANGDGLWALSPDRQVDPGVYTLRADHVTESGSVLARVEIPFARARPLTDLPPGVYVVVQPGNSLWRIARRTYGQGLRYSVIYEANQDQIKDPDLIYPGQIFALPSSTN